VIPLFNVLVDSFAPFLICFNPAHWAIKSLISEPRSSVASGCALSDGSYVKEMFYHFWDC